MSEGITTNRPSNDDPPSCQPSLAATCWHTVRLAMPTSAAMLLSMLQNTSLMLTLAAFGGDEIISSFGVAYSIITMLAVAPNFGLNAALDTLVSQEYGRDPTSIEMGNLLKICILVDICMICIEMTLILTIVPGLLAGILAPRMLADVNVFLAACPFYVLGHTVTHALGKFATNQQQPVLSSIAVIVSSILSVGIFYVMIRNSGEWMLTSAALALGVVYSLQAVILLVLLLLTKATRQSLGGWHIKLSWQSQVWPLLRLGLASIPMVGGEMIAFNVLFIFAAHLSAAENEAYVIRGQLNDWMFSIIFGVATATGALVGEAVGQNNVPLVKRRILAGVIVTLAFTSLNLVAFYLTYRQVFGLYTSSVETLEAADRLAGAYVFFHFGDMLQYWFMVLFCSLGLNRVGAALTMCYLWLVAVPLSWAAAYLFHMGIFGFAMMFSAGLLFGAALYSVTLVKFIDLREVCSVSAAVGHEMQEEAVATHSQIA